MSGCPISDRRCDSYCERIEAFFYTILALLFALKCSYLFIGVLMAEFIFKIATKNESSLFRPLTMLIKNLLSLKPKTEDVAPKLFAKWLGLIFSIKLTVVYLMQWHEAAYVMVGLFVTLALLEALFGYCVGCRIYSLIKIRSR